jgi:hypothetical protein
LFYWPTEYIEKLECNNLEEVQFGKPRWEEELELEMAQNLEFEGLPEITEI